MSDLTTVSTDIISKATMKHVTIEQAIGFLKDAGVEHEIDLAKFQGAASAGVFLGQEVPGYIATRAIITYQIQDIFRAKIKWMLGSKSIKQKELGCKMMGTLVKNERLLAEQLLKAGEILAAKSTMIVHEKRQPDLKDSTVRIVGSNVVLQLESPSKTVEKPAV